MYASCRGYCHGICRVPVTTPIGPPPPVFGEPFGADTPPEEQPEDALPEEQPDDCSLGSFMAAGFGQVIDDEAGGFGDAALTDLVDGAGADSLAGLIALAERAFILIACNGCGPCDGADDVSEERRAACGLLAFLGEWFEYWPAIALVQCCYENGCPKVNIPPLPPILPQQPAPVCNLEDPNLGVAIFPWASFGPCCSNPAGCAHGVI